MPRTISAAGAVLTVLSLWLTATANAAPSGAIFTTVEDGSEVNFNQYPSKEAVYLDGGPGPGAPQTAAGLDDGWYVFQVTDPSGKTLLSTDTARNRQFRVENGIIVEVFNHVTGVDVDHGALTVQLMPYKDTPNHGGVYKVWATPLADYLAGAAALGVNNALDVVDAGYKAGNFHGFIPADAKTDNFKVKRSAIIEVDTRFYDSLTGEILDGLTVTWTDTLGASNDKHSYWAPDLNVFHEAHVESIEPGTHTIAIADGIGYSINHIHCPDGSVIQGQGAVSVKIPNNDNKDLTIFIDVEVDLWQ
jgi:hypothetical protein